MIVSAAVRIYDKKQNKEIVLPVHRHCDAFYILKELGYAKDDFISTQEDQGFLDESDHFYTRVQAKRLAIASGQIENTECSALYSEDLY
jgi:hypothetical protein